MADYHREPVQSRLVSTVNASSPQSEEASAKYPRRGARKRKTRETILKVAREQFQSKGYDAVKMADIAEAADVHITTLFGHFGTKRDLADALAEGELELLRDLIARSQGKVPFFTFFREVVGQWARQVQADGAAHQAFSKDVRSDPDLTFSWVGQHKKEVGLYARYLAADFGLDPEIDMLPYLAANMLTGGNVIAYDRWMKSGGRSDLAKDALAAIDICQAMIEAAPGLRRRPGP